MFRVYFKFVDTPEVLSSKGNEMVILIYGQDNYRSRLKINEIIESYKKTNEKGFDLKCFEAEDISFQDLKNELKKKSMFREKKMIIIRNPFSSPSFKEKFLKEPEEIIKAGDIVLFYEDKAISENDPLLTLLLKRSRYQEFKPLKGQELKNWIKEEIKSYRGQASEAAILKLMEYIGNDLWRAANEIKKLVSHSKLRMIEVRDVELMVKPVIETSIFTTVDAIAAKDKKKAFRLVKKHIENGDSPLYILSMINFQFRNLLTIKDLLEKGRPYYSLPKLTSLHPFIIKKSYSQTSKFTLSELKKIYQKIFQVDIDIKRGRLEPSAALDLLIAEICSLHLEPNR